MVGKTGRPWRRGCWRPSGGAFRRRKPPQPRRPRSETPAKAGRAVTGGRVFGRRDGPRSRNGGTGTPRTSREPGSGGCGGDTGAKPDRRSLLGGSGRVGLLHGPGWGRAGIRGIEHGHGGCPGGPVGNRADLRGAGRGGGGRNGDGPRPGQLGGAGRLHGGSDGEPGPGGAGGALRGNERPQLDKQRKLAGGCPVEGMEWGERRP